MLGPLDVHRLLLSRSVAHEMVHLPRVIASSDELPEVLGLPAHSCVSVRFRWRGGAVTAFAVPAGAQPADTAGEGLAAVSPAVVSSRTQYIPSLACPLGLPAGVALVIDPELARERPDGDVLYCTAGDGATAVALRSSDLLAVTSSARTQLAPPAVLDVTEARLALRTPAG